MSAATDLIRRAPAATTHGTRSCYVTGCRCDACRAANTARHRDRSARLREAANSVTPSGPAEFGIITRGPRRLRVKVCPGANGAACVGGKVWLRGRYPVCAGCIERATVWDGTVSTYRTRSHLLALREAGVGRRAVAAASDVAVSILAQIAAGRRHRIRASTERRILAVDSGAISDGALCDSLPTKRILARLRRKGFTTKHLAELLGQPNSNAPQLALTKRATVGVAARVERLARKIDRGEIVPRRVLVDARAERAWLDALLERGVSPSWLTARLGFVVQPSDRPSQMRPKHVDAIHAFQAEIDSQLRTSGVAPELASIDWGNGEVADLVKVRRGRKAAAA